MNGAELRAEYLEALRATSLDDLRPLFDAGLSAHAIGLTAPALGRIIVAGDRYEPDLQAGGAAFLLPVRLDDPVSPEALDPDQAIAWGEIVDILALHPRHPMKWVLRTGAAEWLGAVEPRYLNPAPVRVWRAPFDWLRADCGGLVLLSHDRRDQYRILSSLGTIITENPLHAAELQHVLDHPWTAPRVLTAKLGMRRAA